MKTNELRYGNYVERNGLIRQIIGFISYPTNHTIVRFEMSGEECMIENLNSILLTEKLLLEFGFEKRGSSIFSFRGFKIYSNDGLFVFNYYIERKELIFVHELQNLYFSLTGKELILNTNLF